MSQRSRNRWGVMLIQSVMGLVFFGLAPVVASSLLAGLLYGLVLAFHLSDRITWI